MRFGGKKGVHVKILSVFITLGVLSILIFAGPAKAFTLGLVVSGDFFNEGDHVVFTTTLDVPEGEILNINYLEFNIYGPKGVSCVFDPNGTIISGCQGISIQPISITNTYGYGFTNMTLNYRIVLLSEGYPGGVYYSEFKIMSDEIIYSEQSTRFIIKAESPEIKRCSIRARDGELTINKPGYWGTRNNLNFKIPLRNAANGGGYLISQHNRDRVSFDIYTNEVLDNTEDTLVVWIGGNFKLGRGSEITENAVMYIDKKNKKLDIYGENLVARDMYVNFMTGC